jgi:hypothetical protein
MCIDYGIPQYMICTYCTSYLCMLAWRWSNKNETCLHDKILIFIQQFQVFTVYHCYYLSLLADRYTHSTVPEYATKHQPRTVCYQTHTTVCYQTHATVCYQTHATVCYQTHATVCYQTHTTVCYQTPATHSNYRWTICCNFNQAQDSTPWWWILGSETCWSEF